MRKFVLPWQTVFVDSTTVISIPAGEWGEADDVAKIGFELEMRAKTGVLEVALGYETADDQATPDTAVAVTAYRTANGLTQRGGLTDIASTTAGKKFIRAVYLVKLTSGSTLTLAAVRGLVYIGKRS